MVASNQFAATVWPCCGHAEPQPAMSGHQLSGRALCCLIISSLSLDLQPFLESRFAGENFLRVRKVDLQVGSDHALNAKLSYQWSIPLLSPASGF